MTNLDQFLRGVVKWGVEISAFSSDSSSVFRASYGPVESRREKRRVSIRRYQANSIAANMVELFSSSIAHKSLTRLGEY